MAKKAEKKAKEENIEGSSKEVIQPEVNIGLIGHVDHGKTTLTERLSGKWTDTHSEELRRGITIRLGYADVVIYKDKDGLTTKKSKDVKLVRKISLVDAPGHESLMATMLAGATIMDGALLLVAANELCPQPQTREHVMALQIMGVKNVVVVQNKIDIVSREQAIRNHKQIKEFLKDTDYKDAPIIPISAQQGVNIDKLLEAIQENIPSPKIDKEANPTMFIARSFDINKPGSKIKDMTGGILGGALQTGTLKVGDEIEIVPGQQLQEKNQFVSKPIHGKITSIITGGKKVDDAHPGGTIALQTTLDPAIIKSDKLTGNVVGYKGKVPPVRYKLKLKTHLMDRVVGSDDDVKVQPIKKGEPLMLNVNAAATVGIVTDISKNEFTCDLKLPVACYDKSRVTISRRVGNRFRLIGYGILE